MYSPNKSTGRRKLGYLHEKQGHPSFQGYAKPKRFGYSPTTGDAGIPVFVGMVELVDTSSVGVDNTEQDEMVDPTRVNISIAGSSPAPGSNGL